MEQKQSEQSEEEKIEAKFNSGLNKIMRLHDIRLALHRARDDGDYKRVYNMLLGWRSELNYHMSDDDKSKANDFELNIRKAVVGISVVNPYTSMVYNLTSDYIKIMYEYELFLGDVENNIGLGAPEKEDDEGL